MKKLSVGIIIFVVAIILAIGSGLLWWRSNLEAYSTNEDFVRVVIPKGRSAEAIGNQLEEENIIKSGLAFKVYVQLYDKQESINSGEFSLSPSMSLPEVIRTLGKGPEEVWVTIPEGLRREEIVERLIDGVGYTGADATTFRNEFLALTEDKEGYLFPDTYLLPRDISAEKVVNLMIATFDVRFDETLRSEMRAEGLTLDETVILASILEKETKTDSERPLVAGIYFNRLEIGMALQADATAQYVWGTNRCEGMIDCDWWQPPTRSELAVDSPYNTYKYADLPPAPISNPGLSSLKAVVESKSNPYYYYIHEPNGTIHYAETLDEHNANVARYLR